jgi:glycosyltransferase involved in cell wall biosynthesis
MKRIKSALVSYGNPRDIATWSGVPFHMLRVLETRFDMALVVEKPWAGWFRPVGRVLKALTLRRFQYNTSAWFTRAAAAKTIARVKAAKPDVVFVVSSFSIAHTLTRDHRVINIADSTVRQMIGYYDSFTRSIAGGAKGADCIEARAISESFVSLYPSSWARESAINDYGATPDRALEIAWGANIEGRARAARSLPAGPLRLLFVGAEWERKGGPLAVAIAHELAGRGVPCQLDIVGQSARVMDGQAGTEAKRRADIIFHGFLRKGDAADSEKLDALFADATFFLLPTYAECFGIVFAEAASLGLPTISIATGGVTSAVRSDVTGMLLPSTASAAEFADAITAIISTPGRYTAMSQAAIDDARDRLNWDVWADAVEVVLRSRLALEVG